MKARHLRMEATFREKAIARIGKFGRKHKHLKFLCYPAAVIVTVAYQFILLFKDNTKRLVSTACVLCAFAASASFSYPAFSMASGFADMSEAEVMGAVRSELSLSDLLLEMEEADYDAQLSARTSSVEEVVEQVNVNLEEDIEHAEDSDTVSLDDFAGVDVRSDTDTAVEDASGEKVFSSSDWRLILINKQHPIPEDYEFPLGNINQRMHCDERIIGNLLEMMQGAKEDGVNLEIRSPYRNMNRQEYLFAAHIDEYMNAGLSFMDAYAVTSQTVTVPNASEHQVGLAIDITSSSYSSLDAGFGNTKAGQWLKEHAAEYGFILRYPEGKEEITGIEYEPWHFRYVGTDAAKKMTKEELTLEEFWDLYLYR